MKVHKIICKFDFYAYERLFSFLYMETGVWTNNFSFFLFFLGVQQAALVLNASRRFRYTLDLKKEEEKEQRRRMIRAHAQVIRVILRLFTNIFYYRVCLLYPYDPNTFCFFLQAALLFKLAGEQQIGIVSLKVFIFFTKIFQYCFSYYHFLYVTTN